MRIMAIDPGPEQSAILIYDAFNKAVESWQKCENDHVRYWLHREVMGQPRPDVLAIEMIASYGMPVGKEVFETCVWIGRFIERWGMRPIQLVYRKDVKLHLCGSVKAKDSNIRQALIDKLGPPGTKKNPGITYGISGDGWAALGVAVTAAEGVGLLTYT